MIKTLSSGKEDDLLPSSSLLSSAWLLSPVSSPPSRKSLLFLPRVLVNKKVSASMILGLYFLFPSYLVLLKHKFSFYLNNSYSPFISLLQYHLCQAVSPYLHACPLMPSSREIYTLLMLFLYLEKRKSTIYMHFTLLAVISLSAGLMTLLIFLILILSMCSIHE